MSRGDTADGESGKTGGNETIRVDDSGRLRIKVPAALADTLGTHLVIGAPVCFSHRGAEWAQRVAARRAVRYDIRHDPDKHACGIPTLPPLVHRHLGRIQMLTVPPQPLTTERYLSLPLSIRPTATTPPDVEHRWGRSPQFHQRQPGVRIASGACRS